MKTAYWEQLVLSIRKDLTDREGRCPWTKALARIDSLLNHKCASRKIDSVELLNSDVTELVDYLDETCARIVEFDFAAKTFETPSPKTKAGKSIVGDLIRDKIRYHLDRELLDRYSSSW